MGYGRGYYDFNEGGMMFTSPGQILSTDENAEYSGYTLLVHPDFIRSYPLAKISRISVSFLMIRMKLCICLIRKKQLLQGFG
jgi:hypothetical protein